MLIDPPQLLGFLLTAGAIVLSPGPDTLLVTRNSLQDRTVGLMTVIGVQLGMILHSIAAIFGLSLLLAAWPLAFRIIALCGAVYLGWLGWRCFRAGFLTLDDRTATITPLVALRDATLTNLLNPKVILLYLSLMPPFVVPDKGRVALQLTVMCALLLIMTLLWQVPLWLLAGRMRAWLERPRVQRGVNWITGAILTCFALLLVWDYLL